MVTVLAFFTVPDTLVLTSWDTMNADCCCHGYRIFLIGYGSGLAALSIPSLHLPHWLHSLPVVSVEPLSTECLPGSLHTAAARTLLEAGIRTGLVLFLSVQLAIDLLVYFIIRRSIALPRVVMKFFS